MTFTNTEKSIINALYNANRPLTTGQVAKRSGIAWVTASLRLKDLKNKGYVDCKYAGNAYYWYFLTERTKQNPPVKSLTHEQFMRKVYGEKND